MYRRIPLALCTILTALPQTTALEAQRVELTPFYGYQFGGDFDARFDHHDFREQLDVSESEEYGAFLGFALNQHGRVELNWVRQDTELESAALFGPAVADLDLQYYHLGYAYEWTPGQMHPFLGASVGATELEPAGLGSETKFSWSFGGGVKIFPNPHFGLRLEGRFYSTVLDSDDQVYCDPFDCVEVDEGSYLFQFDVKAGVIIAF